MSGRVIGTVGCIIAAASMIAACSQAGTGSTDAVPTTRAGAVTSMGPEDAVDYEEGLQPLVEMAIAELSGRLETDPNSIRVVSAELVMWPNQALGCPREGMQYPDVPVDGSRIVLEADGVRYSYHTGGNVYQPFLCENPG